MLAHKLLYFLDTIVVSVDGLKVVGKMGRVTIIELMIALAILTIMAMISVNAFRRYLAKAKLRTAASRITTDFAYYGNKAKAEGRLYTISFNMASPNSYTISAPATDTLNAVKVIRTLSDDIACTVMNDADFTGCKKIRLTQQGRFAHFEVTLSSEQS